MKTLIKKWATRGGKYWLELYKETMDAYTYRGRNEGGCLGYVEETTALAHMNRLILLYAADGIRLREVSEWQS